MNNIEAQGIGGMDAECALSAIFSTITAKQHEVFALLAEGRTSKEIAWRLGVTESAIVQRIEAVRSRAGSPPRAELARGYRLYVARQTHLNSSASAGAAFVAQAGAGANPALSSETRVAPIMLADGQASDGGDTWSRHTADLIVPEIFAGPNAGLNRMAAMVVIALGLLAVAMVGLGVAQALANLL